MQRRQVNIGYRTCSLEETGSIALKFERSRIYSPVMTTSPSRIAFGSCNNQDLQNNLWSIIERRKAAGFIWGGDSIYAGESIGVVSDKQYTYH
jgi:hypothetical protein